jgi:hypothetical protein
VAHPLGVLTPNVLTLRWAGRLGVAMPLGTNHLSLRRTKIGQILAFSQEIRFGKNYSFKLKYFFGGGIKANR